MAIQYNPQTVKQFVDMIQQFSITMGMPYISRDLIREIVNEYARLYIPEIKNQVGNYNPEVDNPFYTPSWKTGQWLPPPPKPKVVDLLKWKRERKKK